MFLSLVGFAATAGGAAAQHAPGDPPRSTIVDYAKAIEAGEPEPGWVHGGKVPYSWGGGHLATPHPSFGTCQPGAGCGAEHVVGLDCSGFSRWVYSLSYGHDYLGPTSSGGQMAEMTKDSSAQLGDLVFFGSPVHHVGVYIGSGNMIDAYGTGTFIRTDKVSSVSGVDGYYHL